MTEEQITDKHRVDAAVKLLKHHDYDNLAEAVERLQQQNKQLIEAMDRASDLLSHNHNAYHYLQDALQQIERNDEES